MDVELIGDEYPDVIRRGRDRLLEMRDKVFFRSSGSNTGSNLFAGRDLEVRDQALRAVADVFVFLALKAAWLTGDARSHRLSRRRAFERLDAGFFIRTDQMNALLVQQPGLFIKVADRFDLLTELFRILLRSLEPILNPMRF